MPKKPANRDQSTSNDKPLVDESKIKGSMHTEEPDGWDQAPLDIKDPEKKRHPRIDKVGGSERAPDKDPSP